MDILQMKPKSSAFQTGLRRKNRNKETLSGVLNECLRPNNQSRLMIGKDAYIECQGESLDTKGDILNQLEVCNIMTKQRYDDNDTPYGKWKRNHDQLDSSDGYVTSDVDYIWRDYNSDKFMLLEEKCNMAESDYPQKENFRTLHNAISGDNYLGFHLLQFENTSPLDGDIYLDGDLISTNNLIKFLQFNMPDKYYKTYEEYLEV